MKYCQIISCIFVLLVAGLSSCEPKEVVDWQVFYKDMKASNTIIEQRISYGHMDYLKSNTKYSRTYETYRHKITTAFQPLEQVEAFIKKIKTDIHKTAKKRTVKSKEIVNLKDTKAPYIILFKNNRLEELLDSFKIAETKILTVISKEAQDTFTKQAFSTPLSRILNSQLFENNTVEQIDFELERLRNRVLRTKEYIQKYLVQFVHIPIPKYDFKILSDPQKLNIKKGEEFNTRIYFSVVEPFHDSVAFFVNEELISAEGNEGIYRIKANQLGEHKYNVAIKSWNPVTGRFENYRRSFQYFVIEK